MHLDGFLCVFSVGLSHARFLSLSCFLVLLLSLSCAPFCVTFLPGTTTKGVGTVLSAYCVDECIVGLGFRLRCHTWLVVTLALAIPILALAVFSFLWRKKSKQRKRDLALTRGLLLHEHSYVDNRNTGSARMRERYIENELTVTRAR